jgi:hypothetical protein
VHIPSEERSKLDPNSRQCIFLGYGKGIKGYKFWDPTANKAVISRDVVFDENFMLKSTQGKKQQVLESSSSNKQMVQVELETPVQENTSQGTETSTSGIEQHHSIATDRPRRTIRPPIRYGFEDMVSYALVISSGDPTTFKRRSIAKRRANGWALWQKKWSFCIKTRRGIWWSSQRGRGR